MKELEDEVIFESHQQGEPCEEVKSLGKERIKKSSACGELSGTGKDCGNRASESLLCSRGTSTSGFMLVLKGGGKVRK